MKRKGIATAALVAMAPIVAHAYSVDGLYVYVALLFALPALLSLTAGLALSTYVKATEAAVIVSGGWIAIWRYSIGARPALGQLLFDFPFVIAYVLLALAAHAVRRHWLRPKS